MTYFHSTIGGHAAAFSSPAQGGTGARTLETGSGVADPRRIPIRVGIQNALWNEVDRGRADQYLGAAFEEVEQGELVALAAAALARLERIELDAAA